MRLENIVALCNAALLNKPSITSFSTISYRAKDIKRGDLFIAKNADEINHAIQNGAYGIIFDTPVQISDHEIAWMKVSHVADALARILRFLLLEKNITAYECDAISLKIASQISTHNKTVAVISGNIFDAYDRLHSLEENSIVLFGNDFQYKSIFVTTKQIPRLVTSKVNIIEQTLFETSFIYEDVFYERKLLSPFFIPYLETLLQLYKSENIAFTIGSFHITEHFQAVFTDNSFIQKEFGSSDKVLIFEPSFEPIPLQIEFLQQQASWAKLIYIVPQSKQNMIKDTQNIFTYNTQLDIIELLKAADFHFALIAEQDKSLLDKSFFVKRQRQLTLDF
jgi:hypothetical protein